MKVEWRAKVPGLPFPEYWDAVLASSPPATDAIAWLSRMPTRDGTSDPTESAEATAEAVKAVVAEAEAIAASPAVADDAEQWCEGGDVLGSPLELPAAAGGRASGMPRLSFFLRTPPSGQSAIPLDRRRVGL